MPDENLSDYENICSLLNIIYAIKNEINCRMNPESFEQLEEIITTEGNLLRNFLTLLNSSKIRAMFE